jgi:hypothetical protein
MKIISNKYLLLFLILFPVIGTNAQKLAFQTTMCQSKPFVFMENKGQIADEKGNVIKDISYYSNNGAVNIYCKKDRIAFVFSKIDNDTDLVDAGTRRAFVKTRHAFVETRHALSLQRQNDARCTTAARIEMQFLNANPNPQTVSDEPQGYYENYYLAHCHDGITAHTFKKITYKNIYPNIDLVLTCNTNGLEYSFVVYPGGDVKDIQIQWNGANILGDLGDEMPVYIYSNSIGYIQESGLRSYLKGTNQAIETRYSSLADNQYGFDVGGYNKTGILVIDPTLVWATYFGGSYNDYATAVHADLSGNAIITGRTERTTGIATSGAYQTSSPGYMTTYLAKFSNNGALLWASYFAPSSIGNGVSTDSSGNIYLTGNTLINGLSTSGAYQTDFKGYSDAYLAKFSGSGSLVWATYFGGSSKEEGHSVCVDHSGNILMAGIAVSSAGIATSGASQTSFGGGFGDAFIAKFNNNGKIIWSTYFGGNGYESGNGITIDANDNVYLAGNTNSSSGIITKSAYQSDYAGDTDAFLVKYNPLGKLLWSTYYGGSGEDNATGVSYHPLSGVFIAGYTMSTSKIASSGAYQSSSTGGWYNSFLARFDTSGNLNWSTYIRGTNAAFGLCTDRYGDVYVAGSTQFSSGLATQGAYQSTFGGYFDAFLVKIKKSGTPAIATYFGGSNIDIAFGVSADLSGNVFIAGRSSSTSNIATSGAYQTSFGADKASFLAKFNFNKNDAGISKINSPTRTYCAKKVAYKIKLMNYGNTELDSVKINWSINSKSQKQYNWTGKLATDSAIQVFIDSISLPPGIDTIRAWTSLPNGFKDSVPENDSAMIIDTVYALPKTDAGGNHTVCSGDKIILGSDSSTGYNNSWFSKPNGFTSKMSNPTINPTSSKTYYLTKTNTSTGCSTSDSAIIITLTLPDAVTAPNQAICSGSNIKLGALPINGNKYSWKSHPPGFMDSASEILVTPTQKTTYYLTETSSATGCSKTDSVVITVFPLPAGLRKKDTALCMPGTLFTIGPDPLPGYIYTWRVKQGIYGKTSQIAVSAYPNIYYFLQTDTITGCSEKDTFKVTGNPSPVPHPGLSQDICSGEKITTGDTMTPGYIYQWESSPTGFSSDSPSISYYPQNTVLLKLTETVKSTGCSGSALVQITVYPTPKPSFYGQKHYCGQISESKYTAHYDGQGIVYNWFSSKGTVLSGQGKDVMTFRPGFGIDTIILIERGPGGCTGSDSEIIVDDPLPNARWNVVSSHGNYYKFKAEDSTEKPSEYYWVFGDGTRVDSSNTTHVFNFKKDTTIKVSLVLYDKNGCQGVYDSMIKIHLPATDVIKIFPNPFIDHTRIDIDLDNSAHIQIVVFDALGRQISKIADARQDTGITSYTWDANKNNLAYGTYFLKIMVDDKVYVRPVVRMD